MRKQVLVVILVAKSGTRLQSMFHLKMETDILNFPIVSDSKKATNIFGPRFSLLIRLNFPNGKSFILFLLLE